MFDEILNLVKEHLGNNPQVAATVPPEQADAVHNEIATHITNTINAQGNTENSNLLSKIESGMAAGGPMASAIEGGLVSSLASKFGLPPAATGAIAGALPGILQKYMQRRQSAGQ